MERAVISVAEDGRRLDVKPKIKGRKLRNVIYWQEALKQQGAEQGLGLLTV